MNVTIEYTVNCSHDAFTKALAKYFPKLKFHEVDWRDTCNLDDDEPDTYSSFCYPNKRHPELTHDLFWKMATTALAESNHVWTALYVRIDGEKAFTVTDGWVKDHPSSGEGPRLRYDEKAFNTEMAERLKKIATLACGHEEGDW